MKDIPVLQIKKLLCEISILSGYFEKGDSTFFIKCVYVFEWLQSCIGPPFKVPFGLFVKYIILEIVMNCQNIKLCGF